jgi:hypothetical protein
MRTVARTRFSATLSFPASTRVSLTAPRHRPRAAQHPQRACCRSTNRTSDTIVQRRSLAPAYPSWRTEWNVYSARETFQSPRNPFAPAGGFPAGEGSGNCRMSQSKVYADMDCGGKAKRRHRFSESALTAERHRSSKSAVAASLCRRSPNGYGTNTTATVDVHGGADCRPKDFKFDLPAEWSDAGLARQHFVADTQHFYAIFYCSETCYPSCP